MMLIFDGKVADRYNITHLMIERSPTAFAFAWVPFQCLTIPLRELCPDLVGTLEEFQEDLFRCVCAPHILVAQEEQALVGTVPGRIGTKSGCREAWRFRNRIRVEPQAL